MSGDRAIRAATWAVVLFVTACAAVVSYQHIYDLGRAHGQTGFAAVLLPLSVDGDIVAAGLMLLHEARAGHEPLLLARVMLWSGIGATLAANLAFGWRYGVIGAIGSAWPAYAFLGITEAMMLLVRRMALGRPDTFSSPIPTSAENAAAVWLAATVAIGNPASSNQLAERFGLSRKQVTKVRQQVTAGANGNTPETSEPERT